MNATPDSDVRNIVIVVGSANIDQIFHVARIPAPGETVMSAGLSIARGGKGQNQAVAAARAGASTTFIAAIGDDGFGETTLHGLRDDGIDVSLLRSSADPTGTALIAVAPDGENTIIVEAGANAGLLGLTPADLEAIGGAGVLVMQLEIPLQTVAAAARAGRAGGTTVILNAAPVMDLPRELLDDVDILVVNEHEAAFLSGESAVSSLAPVVIVTLGAAGSVLHQRGVDDVSIPARSVVAVDATGAGDTFCGAFAARLAEGATLEDSLRFAGAAASLSVLTPGAVPSIPLRSAIDSAYRLETDGARHHDGSEADKPASDRNSPHD
ncbi:ribokinase [Salinibacterium sp. CAN_S4]|uniref:ribokinase n=1 Tax=Salinibacterium sp. CAN_S4 TaxID=2787727 RepID=UPI0018EFE650